MTASRHSAGRLTVSVIIPSHNRQNLVRDAVASVLDQSETTEVIVVDDGSTPPVVAAGVLAVPKVAIVRNTTPLGPSAARNRGLDMATGDVVAFLDDDDRWLPGKLETCLAALDAHPDIGVAAHRTGFSAPETSTEAALPIVLDEPLLYYGTHQTPHPDSLVIRRELTDHVRFAEDLSAAEDVDFVIELARRTPFVLVDRVLAVHGPDAVPSAIGMEKRVAARLVLRERHEDVLYHDAASRSFYHVRLGHLQRKVSRRRALDSFVVALRNDRTNGLAWRGVASTLLPAGVTRRLARERTRLR